MITYSRLLKNIYKYYPLNIEEELCTVPKKEKLRKEKISNKGSLKEKEIFGEILSILDNYAVIDWTDPETCCYELKVLLHEKQEILDDDKILIERLGGTRNDLRIFISVLEPYYYMFIEKTEYDKVRDKWKFKTIEIYSELEKELLRKISRCLGKCGYKSISRDDARIIVPKVQTEIKIFGKANVFDCLFTDMVSIL